MKRWTRFGLALLLINGFGLIATESGVAMACHAIGLLAGAIVLILGDDE